MKAMNRVKKFGAQVVTGVGGVLVSGLSWAAIDTTAVQTAITDAQTSGETVGGYVIAAVAALVVVGLIIGIVRKL
jgi:hypothetical protein